MPNRRLRSALVAAGYSHADVARHVGVDPKTVERWVHADRLPYPRHRNAVASLLGLTEDDLWTSDGEDPQRFADGEIIRIYAKRAYVAPERWTRLLTGAAAQVDMLMFAGLYLPEQHPGMIDSLAAKAAEGCAVRILMGDPLSDSVRRRGEEEGVSGALSARISQTLTHFRSPNHDALTIRLHDTTLYNSIFRADDEMIVVGHVFGVPGPHAPTFHLRRMGAGELFKTYEDAFDRVWNSARPRSEAA